MPLPESVTLLEQDEKKYYLVGTAHVSTQSVTDVEQVIEEVRPDSVCVELCKARFEALTDEDRWSKLDIFKVIREGKMLFLLANLAISAYQRRIGNDLGVKPGAEMLAGVEKAKEVGAELTLADRDIHITLKRTWANLRFWQKVNLLSAITQGVFSKETVKEEEIEGLKEEAQLAADRLSLQAFAYKIRARRMRVYKSNWPQLDNINTPDELIAARARLH